MTYTIKQLAQLAGVTTRTLRYYNQINLLNPMKVDKNKYRIYNEDSVNKLQQIMYYRSLGFTLKKIKGLINSESSSYLQILESQKQLLLKKQKEIDALLINIEKTIKDSKGELKMTDREKFSAFKKQAITKNEQAYGQEIRERYGNEKVDESNRKYLKINEKQLQEMKETENQLILDLISLKKIQI